MNPTIKGESAIAPAAAGNHVATAPLLNAPAKFHNEPLTDFAREASRARMQDALDLVAKQFGREYPLVIDNVEVRPNEWFESLNPSHCKQVVGRACKATIEQAQAAITAAARAFPAWSDTEPAQRAEHLRRAAAGLRRRRFEFAAWAVYECGKPWREADADIAEAIDFCDYYARKCSGWPSRNGAMRRAKTTNIFMSRAAWPS